MTAEEEAAKGAQLAALETAEIELAMGKSVSALGYNGETVSYAAGDIHQVRAIIRRLKRELGDATARRPAARGFVR